MKQAQKRARKSYRPCGNSGLDVLSSILSDRRTSSRRMTLPVHSNHNQILHSRVYSASNPRVKYPRLLTNLRRRNTTRIFPMCMSLNGRNMVSLVMAHTINRRMVGMVVGRHLITSTRIHYPALSKTRFHHQVTLLSLPHIKSLSRRLTTNISLAKINPALFSVAFTICNLLAPRCSSNVRFTSGLPPSLRKV